MAVVRHITLIYLTKGKRYPRSSQTTHRERKKKGILLVRLICF